MVSRGEAFYLSHMKQEFKRLEIPKIQAPHFVMSPMELQDYIDFAVKRVYMISQAAGPTGSHCHHLEEEVFWMLQGSCTAVIDDGSGLKDVRLEAPQDAIYVGNYVWHHFKDFSDDAALLAISSTQYNPTRSDYIEDYDDYLKFIDRSEKPQTVLIFGAEGTLGQYMCDIFRADDAYRVVPATKHTLDLTQEGQIIHGLETVQPDIIINCAAYNNVDAAESTDAGADLARKLNVEAAQTIAQWANKNDAVFMRFSSDYVFDGKNQGGYDENAEPSPLSVYGKSQADGEIAARNATQHYNIRVSRLFGRQGASADSKKSFVDLMLELAQTKESLSIIDDERSCPTFAKDVAIEAKKLIDENADYGIYHLANSGTATYHELATATFEHQGVTIATEKVAADSFDRAAVRPQFGELLNTKRPSMRHWKDALIEYLNES